MISGKNMGQKEEWALTHREKHAYAYSKRWYFRTHNITVQMSLEVYFEQTGIAHNRPSPHLKLPSTIISDDSGIDTDFNTPMILVCPCKHQAFALQELRVPSVNFVPQYSDGKYCSLFLPVSTRKKKKKKSDLQNKNPLLTTKRMNPPLRI